MMVLPVFSFVQTFGVASIAQMVLSRGKNGTFFSVNFGWGIGVTLGCYWAGGISGKLLNFLVLMFTMHTFALAYERERERERGRGGISGCRS